MGELRNCPQCGKVFMLVARNLCPACIELEEKQYDEVREYLRKNAGATVEQIIEDTGVEEPKVLRWMRDGRLVIVGAGGKQAAVCQRCGRLVEKGNLCSKCIQILEEIKGVKGSSAQTSTGFQGREQNIRDSKSGMHIKRHEDEE